VHQRFRHKPYWQPIHRKRYGFISVAFCSIVAVFRFAAITSCVI
jgi:hypothetical protein